MSVDPGTIGVVERLQHEASIRDLKNEYALLCDSGYPPEKLVPMFVEDATWESNSFGNHSGRDEIFKFFGGVSSDIVWAKHFMLNPIVKVDDSGRTASAKWCLFMPCTMVGEGDAGDDAVFMCAAYDDDLVLEDDGWKFRRVRVHFDFVSNLDQGWVRQPLRGS